MKESSPKPNEDPNWAFADLPEGTKPVPKTPEEKEKLVFFLERDKRIQNRLSVLLHLPGKVKEINNLIFEHAEKLKEKYPDDYFKRTMYHVLAGGISRFGKEGEETDSIEDDFSDEEDSVEKFINKLEETYLKKHNSKEE